SSGKLSAFSGQEIPLWLSADGSAQSVQRGFDRVEVVGMPKLVFSFRDGNEGMLPVEIANGRGAAVHLLVFLGADEDVGGRGGVAGLVGNHPALGLVVVLEEERRNRTEN